jgi:hypothetical protein
MSTIREHIKDAAGYIKDLVPVAMLLLVGGLIVSAILQSRSDDHAAAPAITAHETYSLCQEDVIEDLKDALTAYKASTYKAKRDAAEQLAAAAEAVNSECTEIDRDDGPERDAP